MTRYTTAFVSLLAMVAAQNANRASDIENGVCAPVTLVFARGSTEQGNMGTVVGPPLATAMKAAFGNVAVQGVNYPASIQGAISGATDPKGAAGSMNMAMMATAALAACPNTKVVLAGYSQGAEQVRGALMNMPANKVAAAVTFGDPLQAQPFVGIDAAKTKINCADGDAVCNAQFQISAAHLSYGTNGNIEQSVQFVKTAMGMTAAAPPAAPAA